MVATPSSSSTASPSPAPASRGRFSRTLSYAANGAMGAFSFALTHPRSTVSVLGTAGLAIGLGFLYRSPGTTIYEGDIAGRHVRYVEDVNGAKKGSNIIYLKDGQIEYTLIDSADRISLDWKSNEVAGTTRSLEQVIITKNGTTHRFPVDNALAGDIDRESAKKILAAANVTNADILAAIRARKRADYSSQTEDFSARLGTVSSEVKVYTSEQQSREGKK